MIPSKVSYLYYKYMILPDIKNLILPFILGIVVGVLGVLIISPSKECDPIVFNKSNVAGTSTLANPEGSIEEDIVIDVSGAVVNPGVYKLKKDSRISDAINVAGGVLDDNVNKELLSKSINLAQILHDGEKLYIPFLSDSSQLFHLQGGRVDTNTVNINTAAESELDSKLVGIGPVYAKKIVDGRPYVKIDDLIERKIVPNSTYEKIKGSITVN